MVSIYLFIEDNKFSSRIDFFEACWFTYLLNHCRTCPSPSQSHYCHLFLHIHNINFISVFPSKQTSPLFLVFSCSRFPFSRERLFDFRQERLCLHSLLIYPSFILVWIYFSLPRFQPWHLFFPQVFFSIPFLSILFLVLFILFTDILFFLYIYRVQNKKKRREKHPKRTQTRVRKRNHARSLQNSSTILRKHLN